jgi:hypothetical protein
MPIRGLTMVCSVWLIAVSASCSEAAGSARLAQLAAPIVGGRPSDASQNAVVVLVRGAFLDYCTAVVIAPTVVMTARHCLYGPTTASEFYEECDTSVASLGAFVLRPEDFIVQIGAAKPLDTVALGKEIYTSDALDLCANDLALLELDSPVPVSPLPLRLDAPPEVGEEAVLVGWGYSALDEPNLPNPRQQRESRVLQLGGENVGRSGPYLEANLFVSTEAGCGNDDGAPLISTSTKAVIGLQRAVLGAAPAEGDDPVRGCIGGLTLLERIDARESWIRSTLRRLGTAPWIEGKAAPAEPGADCNDADECVTGICVGAGDERYCSASCTDQECPEGMVCMGPEDGRVCALENSRRFDAAGSCAMAGGRAPSLLLTVGVCFAAAMIRRRARAASPVRREARERPMVSSNSPLSIRARSYRHVSR